MAFRKGNYVLCRYQGDNGDLIAGCVESVRRNGDIILRNLLTDARSVKRVDVLEDRNVVVPKYLALGVVDTYTAHGKAKAREAAVEAVADLMDLDDGKEVIVKVPVVVSKTERCHSDCPWGNEQECILYDEPREHVKGVTHPYKRCKICVDSEYEG